MTRNRNSGPVAGRDARGRFGAGNPGRPPGTRLRATRAAEALLDGEAEALTRKAVELALAGDTVALRLCLDRLLPPRKGRAIAFDPPAEATAAAVRDAALALLRRVACGDLSGEEAGPVMALIEGARRTLETEDLERRLAALEALSPGAEKP